MARKKDQGARRAELGEAVQRAVLARGLEGLRLRDIAEQAGVTPAAVLYYGDLDALIYETYQRAIERFSQERERVADQFPTRATASGPASTTASRAGRTTNWSDCCSSAGRDHCATPRWRPWTVR